MNKYIIPAILIFIIGIFLTWLITYKIVSNKYEYQINEYEGMKKTYIEEIYVRDEIISQIKEEICDLKFNLESREKWCNSE